MLQALNANCDVCQAGGQNVIVSEKTFMNEAIEITSQEDMIWMLLLTK